MSSIGSISTPTPTGPIDDGGSTARTTSTGSGGSASATVSRTPTSSRPVVGTGRDTDLDGISDTVEKRLGLDPNAKKTERSIGDREAWSIPGSGYAAYGDDAVTLAVHKYGRLFDSEGAKLDGGASYWEMFNAGPKTMESGTWLPDEGSVISEADFERTTGVNVWGDQAVGSVAYELMRKADAPQGAVFAMRSASGTRLEARSTDELVPTYVDAGGKIREAKFVESQYGAGYTDAITGHAPEPDEVVWRLKTAGGTIRGSKTDKAETREELLSLKGDTKLDFIDAQGEVVVPDKEAGDRIAACWKEGDHWVALSPKYNPSGQVSSYTKYVYDADGDVKSQSNVAKRTGDRLVESKGDDVIYRIQARDGELKGDGEVGDTFDMSWWGRCQNVATIDQSNIKEPDHDLYIVKNHDPSKGEELALTWTDAQGKHVAIPKRDRDGKVTGYDEQIRNARGDVTSTKALTLDEGKRLTEMRNDRRGMPVIVTRDGKLKDADYEVVTRRDAIMLTALMNDGATHYKGNVGERFWGQPDQVVVDGRTVPGKIVSVKTAGGRSLDIVRRNGNEWSDAGSHILRGNDFKAETRYVGRRSTAWTETSMASINARRTGNDAIRSVVFEHPDGRRETIDAAKIGKIGRENLYDMKPTDLWKATEWIADGKSFTAEKAAGEQVWNYGVKSLSHERLTSLPRGLADENKQPGALAGTTGDEGKLYFKTKLDTVGGPVDLVYWVKLDAQGKLKDFNYLQGSPPDFFWQSHVKDSFTETWTGEGNVAGTNMRDIQRLYNASIGGYDAYAVGDVISTAELEKRKAIRP